MTSKKASLPLARTRNFSAMMPITPSSMNSGCRPMIVKRLNKRGVEQQTSSRSVWSEG